GQDMAVKKRRTQPSQNQTRHDKQTIGINKSDTLLSSQESDTQDVPALSALSRRGAFPLYSAGRWAVKSASARLPGASLA
ncbi:hypothetical protein, partial [Ornithinimicrobium sufpigmenti]|uniref:hypothetical protein n=1 Tax=Ornithinimicrobium sufpigmenti TaxID=2508882 RepID=UPI001EDCC808